MRIVHKNKKIYGSFLPKLKAIFGYVVFTGPKFISAALSFIMVPAFIKAWGTMYAVYIILMSLIGYSNVVSQPIVISFMDRMKRLPRVSVLGYIPVFGGLYFLSVAIAIVLYLLNQKFTQFSIFIGVILPFAFGVLYIIKSWYIYENRLMQYVCVETLFLLLKVPVSFWLVDRVLGLGFDEYLLVYAVATALEVAVHLFVMVKAIEYSFFDSLIEASKTIKIGIRSFLAVALVVVVDVYLGSFDRLFLSGSTLHGQLVVYSTSLTVSCALYILVQQINTQSQSEYFKTKDSVEKYTLIKKNSIEIAIVTLPIFLGFILFGRLALHLWLGATLQQDEIIVIYRTTLILMVGAIFNSLCGPLSNCLLSMAYGKRLLRLTVIAAIVMSLLMPVLLLFQRIEMYAIGYSVVFIVKYILSLIAIQDDSKRGYNGSRPCI